MCGIWCLTICIIAISPNIIAATRENCTILSSILKDIIESDARTLGCDVHIVGTLDAKECAMGDDIALHLNSVIRRPISNVVANTSMKMGDVLFRRCVISIIGMERLEEFINLAGDYQRTFTDFFIVLVENEADLWALPNSLNAYSSIVIVVWNKTSTKGTYLYGQGIYTEGGHFFKPIGKWTTEGLKPKGVTIFPSWRSSHFRGRGELLTVLGYNNDQAVILVNNGSFTGYVHGNDTNILSGSDVNMLRFIASRRNLNIRFWINNGGYGAPTNSSGRFPMWTPGYLNYLRYGQADIMISYPSPISVAFFCISFFPSPTYQFAWQASFYTAFPKHQDNWYGFLDPFKKTTWIALLVAMLVFLATLHMFLHEDFFNEFGYMFVSLTALGNGILRPSQGSHFILLLAWILPTAVLYFSYSTSLMSSLILALPGRPVDTWQQLYDRRWNLLICESVNAAPFVMSAIRGVGAPILGEIWNTTSMVTKIPYKDLLEPYPLQKRVVDTPKTAVVFTADSFVIATDVNGNVVLRQSAVETINPHFSTYLVRRNMSYFEPLYQDFLWLRDTGATEIFNMQGRIEKNWLYRMMKFQASKIKPSNVEGDSSAAPIDINKLQGAFYLLICGCVIAVTMFVLFELIRTRIQHEFQVEIKKNNGEVF